MASHTLHLDAFEGRTGRGVRVVVIDSGVHADHPHVGGVAGGIGFDAFGDAHPDYIDRLGHGTAVTAVIREKAPEAEVFVAKVFDRELSTTGDALVAAIEWAIGEQAHLINLSLGTVNSAHEPALARVVSAARAAGVTLVTAAASPDIPRLPGRLAGVLAVHQDDTIPREACRLDVQGDAVRAWACGYPRPIPGVPPERNLRGISFAVANVTGLLARASETGPPFEVLGDILVRKS